MNELSARGKQLMEAGQFEDAIDVYRQMVKALPGNPGLVLNLALAEQMGGHPEQSVPHFEAVLRAQPNNIPALTSLGMARLQMNQPEQAIVPLKKLVALQPGNVNARGMLAGAELGTNHFDEGAAHYRKLTELTPEDPKAWYGLGKAYEALAGARFDQLTKLKQDSPYVASLLGDARLVRHQYRSAFFFYNEAKKQMPELPGLHAGLAHVYRETGHADWAQAEDRLEAKISDTSCQSAKQECQFLSGRLLAAAENKSASTRTPESLFWSTRAYNALAAGAFDRLNRLPASVESHAVKAQVLHDHGQDLQAAAEWRAALAIAPDPNDEQLKTELTRSLFLGRDYASAIPMIKELLRDHRDAPDLNFMLGESLWRTQRAEEAVPALESALSKDPGMLPAHAALGLALVSLNRTADAIPHLEKAVSLDDDGSLHYSLARAYQSAGLADKARAAMQEYSTIQRRNNEVNSELAKEAEITAPAAPPAQ